MLICEELGFDPIAMAVVLYVIHGRAEQIPATISFENLLEIAIICDYYDCAAAMNPWGNTWMKPLHKLALEPGYEDWLFVALVFRNQELFGQITKDFIRKGVIAEDGEFGVMVNGEVRKMHSHLPDGIIRDMAARRTAVGEDIARLCRHTYDKYDDHSTVKCEFGTRFCDNVIFAALHHGMAEMGFLGKLNKQNEQRNVHTGRTLG
ncbi:hypothetical protein K440DRAFT_586816, partial [Wilcoxina mikolae CBS 423.85]